jgi:DNA primase
MAGIKASIRGIDMLLEEGMNIKVMLLPDGDDPDSFARKHNATEFQEYIAAHEVDFIRFKTNLLMSDAANDPYKRATLITDIVKSISVIPEAIVRSEYVKECSQMLHVEERILVNEISKMKREEEERKAKKEERRTPDTPIEIKEGEASTPSYHQADAPNSDVPLPPYDDMPPADPTLHMGAIGANHPEYTPAPTLGENRDTSLLYAKERLIIQQVIRHGESIVYEDEQTGSQYTVGTYIAEELGRDEIALQTPIFAQILN